MNGKWTSDKNYGRYNACPQPEFVMRRDQRESYLSRLWNISVLTLEYAGRKELAA